ncbi:MAG: hypothetical protein HOP29_03550 [Phycisphaerales bacterium]|nr:hypothetical protein [Phycisphaerales bacterium]
MGVTAAGYARGLVAGDQCVGVAHEEINNTGASAAKSVRVMTVGDIEHSISGATVADVGRAVYASADDTLTFSPDGNSFVGRVKHWLTGAKCVVRLGADGPALQHVNHHAAGFTLTAALSGTLHTNLGASGAIVATLPQSPPAGISYRFVCMADQELRLEPGAAGGLYVKGAKQADDKYVSVTDIGDFIELVADGNGDWLAAASINGADADITVEA